MRIVRNVTLVIALATMACGKESFICHSRQSEAKVGLNALHNAETTFREAHGKFAGSLEELQFTPPEARYYDVKIDSATATTYGATATGKGESKGDAWTIDQLGNPIVKVDGCK